MAIRFDKNLNQRINKAITNYNRKISRLEKNQNIDVIIPNRVNKRNLLKDVTTRQELKKKLTKLELYSTRNIEKSIVLKSGEILSNYEYTLLKQEKRAIKQRLAREITKLENEKIRVAGKKQDTTFAESGDKYYLNKKARYEALNKDINKLKSKELQAYMKLIEKSRKSNEYYDNIFKDNYLTMLDDLENMYKLDKTRIKEVKEKLKKLPPKEFTRIFNEDKLIKAMLDYYIPKKDRNRRYKNRKVTINPVVVRKDMQDLFNEFYEKIDIILEESNIKL